MNNVTAIIISFLRIGYTKKCISSLRTMYPDIKIKVGENGHYLQEMKDFCDDHDAEYIELPFDSGVCIARNRLMAGVDTEYVMVGDDDFHFINKGDSKPMVKEMVEFLETMGDFDLIGGRILQYNKIRDYQGFFEKGNGFLKYHKLDMEEKFDVCRIPSGEIRYKKVDLTFNYFVARANKVKAVKWDEKIKVAYEHSSWFLDFKDAGHNVAFSPDPIVIHKPEIKERYPEYMKYRIRRNDKKRFFERHNLRFIKDMNGNVDFPYDRTQINKVDFLITTFKRYESLEKLLFSIAKYYPNAKIYIADQNKRFAVEYYRGLWDRLASNGLINKPTAYGLTYDIGLSYCRNYLVEKTDRIYKLILDDDFVFTEETNIEKFVDILDKEKEAGIVGGAMKQNDEIVHFEFNLERDGDVLKHVEDGDNWREIMEIKVKETECVLNFALIRKEVANVIGWDEALKITEHTDFYLRMKKTDWKILYTPEVVVLHKPERDEEYGKLRSRFDFFVMMLKKHRLRKIQYINGHTYELNGNKIIQYKA